MAGGDLSGIEPRWFCAGETGQPILIDLDAKKKEIEDLQAILKSKSHVLVGHNLFTDLVYIYKTFIGTLPKDVTEFNRQIHEIFPQVIDTKYLATHEGGSMRTRSSLKDLCDEMKHLKKPTIFLAEDHTLYAGAGKEHEAGYDSMAPI